MRALVGDLSCKNVDWCGSSRGQMHSAFVPAAAAVHTGNETDANMYVKRELQRIISCSGNGRLATYIVWRDDVPTFDATFGRNYITVISPLLEIPYLDIECDKHSKSWFS